MTRKLLALFVALMLLLPSGWAGAAAWLCKAEGVVHVLSCCDHAEQATVAKAHDGCGHEEPEASACCSPVETGDDRATAPEPPPSDSLAVLASGPSVMDWPAPRAMSPSSPDVWETGPPATGPPTWLRLRTLLL